MNQHAPVTRVPLSTVMKVFDPLEHEADASPAESSTLKQQDKIAQATN